MLRKVKAGFDFLIYTHVFIGLIAVSLTLSTYKIFRLPIHWTLIAFIFISTFTAYNFSVVNFRNRSIRSNGTARQNTLARFYFPFKIMIVLGIMILLGLSFYLPQKCWFILSIESLLAFFYSVPLIRFQKTWVPLRKIPQLKIWILCVLWTLSTVAIPLWISPIPQLFTLRPFYIQSLRVFLLVFVNALLFDIRDLSLDHKNNLVTLSGQLGIINTKRLAYSLILIVGILNFISIPRLGLETSLAFYLTALILFFITVKARENRSEYFYMFWLDGALMTPWIFISLFDWLRGF